MHESKVVLDPVATASYLGVAKQTLARWRCEGGGPAFLKLGTRIRYERADLDRWLDARRRRSTSDQSPLAAQ
jgi:excisionase family DNA binding protein